jgi:DNA repair protein RecO (recombination protein O)
MATYSTAAIIIGRHNFGEADRIMILLTPDRGVIRGVAKGVRRIKSRLAGHLELFSESQLMLAEGRNMDVVTSARLIRHVEAGDDYNRMRLAYLFAEMVNRLGGENEHHDGLYELLQEAYQALIEDGPSPLLELWFKLRLLDRLGYRPELKACIVCGTKDANREYSFNVELGGIVDVGCSQPGNEPMTHDQIKLWRLMLSRPYKSLLETPGLDQLATKTLPICNRFYDYTFGKRFRSAEVLT